MRVLHVVHDFGLPGRGGTQTHVQTLIGRQVSDGFRVSVFSNARDRQEPAVLEGQILHGVPVYRVHRSELFFDSWDKSASPEVLELFDRALDEAQPEIVHLHHGQGLSRHLATWARARGIPVVWTLHDFWTTCPRVFRVKPDEVFCREPAGEACVSCAPRRVWQTDAEVQSSAELYREDFRREIGAASALVALTATHRDALAGLLEIPPGSIHVIPNGYDRRSGGPGPRPAPADPFRILTWSLFSPIKGVHLLIDAFRELVRERPHAELVLLGAAETEDYGRELHRRAEGLPVRFAGPFQFEDLAGQAPDVAVLPTLAFESYSYLVDEALDLGWPMVVSDLGPLSERAGSAARTFRRGDASDLARVLGELYDDRDELETMRRAIEVPSFATADNARQLAEVYRQAREDPAPELMPVDLVTQWRQAVVQRETAQEWCLAHEGDAMRLEDLARQLREQREEDQRKGSHIAYLEGRVKAQAEKITQLEKQVADRGLENDRKQGHIDFLEQRVADLEVVPLPRRSEPPQELARPWLERALRRLAMLFGGSRPR